MGERRNTADTRRAASVHLPVSIPTPVTVLGKDIMLGLRGVVASDIEELQETTGITVLSRAKGEGRYKTGH